MAERRSAWITIPLMMLLFVGGAALGLQLAETYAPDSALAAFANLFMLPLAFIAGFHLWLGFALVLALGHGLAWVFRRLRRTPAAPRSHGPIEIPPGSIAFLPCALISTAAVGLLTAILASEAGFLWVWLCYLSLGLIYGLACWWLARNGWLPFPDEA